MHKLWLLSLTVILDTCCTVTASYNGFCIVFKHRVRKRLTLLDFGFLQSSSDASFIYGEVECVKGWGVFVAAGTIPLHPPLVQAGHLNHT